jgi:hypothetical protein
MDKLILISGFDSYYFNTKTCDVITLKKNEYKILKPSPNWTNEKVYIFYRNGMPYKMSITEILKRVLSDYKVA